MTWTTGLILYGVYVGVVGIISRYLPDPATNNRRVAERDAMRRQRRGTA